MDVVEVCGPGQAVEEGPDRVQQQEGGWRLVGEHRHLHHLASIGTVDQPCSPQLAAVVSEAVVVADSVLEVAASWEWA